MRHCYLLLLATASLTLPACSERQAKYTFNTGAGGSVIWRCNHETGQVDICRDAEHWSKIKEEDIALLIDEAKARNEHK